MEVGLDIRKGVSGWWVLAICMDLDFRFQSCRLERSDFSVFGES
jgi:hypothetical protein